jgi:hypothetical protein
LPDLTSNGSCVAAADYDKDGDLDLFVGGRSMPGSYPEADFSYLLKNQSANGLIKFVYASEQKEMALRQPGLVNTVVWSDLNKDGWVDLIVAGEFMAITVFENHKGQLQMPQPNMDLRTLKVCGKKLCWMILIMMEI